MTTRQQREQKRQINDARASYIGWMLRRAAEDGGSVYGPAPLWLALLTAAAPATVTGADDWPQSPRELGRTFAELSEGLRASGVILSRSRATICGHVHRVWRVDSLCNYNLSPKPRPILLGGKPNSKPSITPNSAKISASHSENLHQQPEEIGAPVMPIKTRKTTVEACRKVCAAEAAHVGAATVETQVAGTAARRLWAICSECERRVCFLYQLPSGGPYLCSTCQNLTYRARQQKGTRAEFAAWLTPARYEKMAAKHPALKSFYEQIGADFRKNVETFDLAKISVERRAELLTIYASDEVIKRIFKQNFSVWSERMEERGQAVGEQILGDLWRWWKSLKKKPTR